MLSQLKQLSLQSEGRYATDVELEQISQYAQSFSLRLQTYQKLQVAEKAIVEQVYAQMHSQDSRLFQYETTDVSSKWKRDTIRVLRYSALALLLNDPETHKEKLLYWMQTIMRAFGAQQSCETTYEVMQAVVRQHLTPTQANLFCPILEINRRSLGAAV